MVGRIGGFVIGGAAIFAGMVVQGDVDLDQDNDVVIHRSERSDRDLDRKIDRIVDRATRNIDVRDGNGKAIESDPALTRALAGATAELVRAEIGLTRAQRDDNLPKAAVEQAERRRDMAREAVERIADDARTESRDNRDTLRQTIRDQVRESVRDAARS